VRIGLPDVYTCMYLLKMLEVLLRCHLEAMSDEMVRAGVATYDELSGAVDSFYLVQQVYIAMLAAKPSDESQTLK
jgi:hypothetical protein